MFPTLDQLKDPAWWDANGKDDSCSVSYEGGTATWFRDGRLVTTGVKKSFEWAEPPVEVSIGGSSTAEGRWY